MLLASWPGAGSAAGLSRCWTSRQELLQLLFRPGAPAMPRPGDWFCSRCLKRNMPKHFFCRACGTGAKEASVLAPGTIKVPGMREYPLPGDWGCGGCGTAMMAYDTVCTKCGAAQQDHRQSAMAAA
uniref:RanBP2-type domain-containing protein n=1 Tax=Pyrodinium bahamense TaxID=73915 RepID=A0A7S0A4B8_9DINO